MLEVQAKLVPVKSIKIRCKMFYRDFTFNFSKNNQFLLSNDTTGMLLLDMGLVSNKLASQCKYELINISSIMMNDQLIDVRSPEKGLL